MLRDIERHLKFVHMTSLNFTKGYIFLTNVSSIFPSVFPLKQRLKSAPNVQSSTRKHVLEISELKERTSDVLAPSDFSSFSTTIETTLTLLLFSLSSYFTFLNCSLCAQVSSLCLIYYQDQQGWNLWNPLIEKPLKAARMKRSALSFQRHIHVELFN